MNKVKIALIGCGRIAYKHFELLANNQIANAELVAICDTEITKAEALAKNQIAFYSDYHQLAQNEDVDLFVILTESGNHAGISLQLAPYKKHLMVEKPMALTINDAEAMIEATQKNNIKLFVVKQNRFNIPVVKLREALKQGRFGKIFMGTIRVRWCRPQAYYDRDSWRGTWAKDGGVIANQASHHVDLLQWCMGEVESVFAKGVQALADIETEDTMVVLLKFKSGALGVIEATTATRPKDIEGSISILGEKGTVEIGGFAVNELKTWNFTDKLEEEKEFMKKYSVNPPNVYGYGHKAYYESVMESILKDETPLVDGIEGLRSLRLIQAIYESAETKREIFLEDFKPQYSRLGKSK